MTTKSWRSACVALALVAVSQSPTTLAASGSGLETAREGANGEGPRMLSAFFGLDNSLPPRANALCMGASGKDGMPIVLSHTVDPETLQPEDFTVVTRSGAESAPHCVTLRPAQDPGEGRTVLLIGEFGDATGDPPARVRVSGNLLSDGTPIDQGSGEPMNFRGAEVEVTPLDAGPALVWAEIVPEDAWPVTGRGTACPTGTRQVVRVTWAGGVRLPSRDEVGDAERALYRVTVAQADGSEEDIVPADLADLGDNDNNHLLCLDTAAQATAVSFPAGHLVDPNGDLNPDTRIAVTDTLGEKLN